MQKYASKHNARDNAQVQSAEPAEQAEQPASPRLTRKCIKQAKGLSPISALQAPSKCNASSSTLVSGGSHAPAHTASVDFKHRKRRQETPAALADPLGAFARHASQRQRTLQSGLSLLKGKASQTRVVAPNMTPPNAEVTAQLDNYRFQPAHTSAKPAAQQTQTRKHQSGQQPQELVHHKASTEQHGPSQKLQQPKIMDRSPKKRPPLTEIQSPGPSQHSISRDIVQDQTQVARKVNGSYFKDIRSSLHKLLQANHAIPHLHTMTDTDRSALASMLTNKLDGVDIVIDLQQHFASTPNPDQHHHQSEPQQSAASSVDCTPSPDSVARHSARACQPPKSSLPRQHVHLSAMPSMPMSYASHASGASSGSGHRHLLTDTSHAGFRPAAAADANLELFDFLTHDAHDSLEQGQGLSCSDVKSINTDEAAFAASPKLDWYVSLFGSN